jgi:2-oxoglutarate dehydrogenase E2 component (dihydrolipoamide succinyltransferase)
MADITLPQLGETVTEGTILRWFKRVGEHIAADEPLFEVSTDKVDTEVPSPISGTVLEIRAGEGDIVAVGTVVAVVGATDSTTVVTETPVPPPAPEPEPPEPEPPAPEPEPPVAVTPPAGASADEPAPPAAAGGDTRSARLLSPVVRRLVNEHGLDPDSIPGTGVGGRVTREDVLDHIDKLAGSRPAPAAPAASAASAAPAAAPPAPVAATAAPAPAGAGRPRTTSVKLSKIRKLTGAHMVMSKSVSPHAFSVVEVDYANVDAVRTAVKSQWKQEEGFSLTYLPFISRAVVDALARFPHLNASVGENELTVHDYVDLGIAVDMDYQGLLVPIVRDAGSKRLRAIAREINDLATRAKSRKLSPDEIQGGTFTITNNGSAGSVLTMAIINQPQVAILSTDAIVRKPVVVHLPDGTEAIAIHPVGHLAMSWDHRAFDGAYAANFLVEVKKSLETRDWIAEL